MKKRVKAFLQTITGDKEDQLAIPQCLDLETTRAWLYREIDARFLRLEEEEEKKE